MTGQRKGSHTGDHLAPLLRMRRTNVLVQLAQQLEAIMVVNSALCRHALVQLEKDVLMRPADLLGVDPV